MANDVFANGREISCRAAEGKSIAAFPDVCLTPPTPPAGFLPIPYPNTAFATDTAGGTRTVKISGEEVMMKNKSFFKKSTGDEAATRSTPMGVLTHTITGKVYFTSWSMDVKFEGENVVRMADLTTHNHMSMPGNTPPWMYADQTAFDATGGKVCEDQAKDAEDKCQGAPPKGKKGLDCSQHPGCAEAKACVLRPKKQDKAFCCADDTTGHHLLEVHCFTPPSGRKAGATLPEFPNYKADDAPCVCGCAPTDQGTHGVMHSVQGKMERFYAGMRANAPLQSWGPKPIEKSYWNYGEARDTGALAHKTAFPHCNAACIKKDLDDYHKNTAGVKDDTPVRTDTVRRRNEVDLGDRQMQTVRADQSNIANLNRGRTAPTFSL